MVQDADTDVFVVVLLCLRLGSFLVDFLDFVDSRLDGLMLVALYA